MRPRTLALMSILAAVGALAVVLFFASRDDSARNDALLFLDRYDGIDVDDPLEERRERIGQLSRLPLPNDEVDRVRDVCIEAHQLLIRAEDRSAEARGAFDEATRGGIEENDIPTDTRVSIEAALEESNESLARAREQMPRCADGARDLRLRFARR